MTSTTYDGAYAVIGDLVGSRSQPERRAVQDALLSALALANADVPAIQPLEPTIGDEFQGAYAALYPALLATLLVRLHLPEGMDARFGIGWGRIEVVGRSAYGLTQDGPAWWAARDAIVAAKDGQQAVPQLRTRIGWSGIEAHPDAAERERRRLVAAYLECRDFMVTGFDGRQRRLAAGLYRGRTVTSLAEQEGISVSATSQRIRSTGVRSVVESIRDLTPMGGLDA